MKKNKLKALIKEAFLAEGKNTLLNENAPGFDNRKQGGPLPTLEGIKAAYQAKKLEEAGVEEITTVTKMTKPAEAAEIAKAEGTPKTTVDAAIKKAKTSGKDVSIAEDTLEGGVSYDSLIGPIISGMVDLKRFVEKEAPEHLNTYKAAEEAIKAFDYVMAYGEEDTLKEDRFVDSSLEDLEQVVRNLAHTAGMGIEEAAEMAMMHIEDMFMGGNEEEELEEEADKFAGSDPKAGSTIKGTGFDWKKSVKGEEVEDNPGTLVPVGKRTIYGTVEKYTKLPNGQVKVHYDTGDKQVLQKERGVWVEVDYTVNKPTTNEVEIAEATELPKDIEWEFDDVIDQMDAYNATISLTGHSESTGKDYTASAEASRGGPGGDWDWMEVDEVEEEPINESVITKADKIVESFRK